MRNHDAPAGPLDHCQICGSVHLREIIDLGHQPPCDSLLTFEDLGKPEITYPLRLMQCPKCSLAQLSYVVPATTVYPRNYPYRAGLSWPVVAAHKEMAAQLIQRFAPRRVLDIGCNDGTLLSQFKEQGCSVIGVEPTGIADLARGADIPTIKSFFTEETARSIGDLVDLITMTNVFAHMGDLGEVMRGIKTILNPAGVLVIENHYLRDVLERNQFDTIYHEHIRTYSLQSLMQLFEQYGMEVFDVERVPRYGGNIRVYVAGVGKHGVQPSVGKLLQEEVDSGMNSPTAWRLFRMNVEQARQEFMEAIAHRDVVGCSAPGRASTLLNYFGVKPSMMRWTGEVKGSFKIGKFVPGCHIPIVSNRRLIDEQPDYVVLLAWHYAAEIAKRLRSEGVRSTLLTPLPQFGVVK